MKINKNKKNMKNDGVVMEVFMIIKTKTNNVSDRNKKTKITNKV